MTVTRCPTVVARGASQGKRGGSVLGTKMPSMEAQYAGMNRAAFNTRNATTRTPLGATRSEVIDATKPRSPVLCGWNKGGDAPLTMAEKLARVQARMAEAAAAKREAARWMISDRATIGRAK